MLKNIRYIRAAIHSDGLFYFLTHAKYCVAHYKQQETLKLQGDRAKQEYKDSPWESKDWMF
jgi:hypothetical protein